MNNYNNARSEQERQDLINQVKKKIQTTMIGALSSIEEHLSFLWQDEEKLSEIYQKLRSEILDKGNKQIRYAELDILKYEVNKKKVTTIPINKD